ncbi:hypothetical protein [Shimia biformata]|uniref:hypothetical protein n=1 Tax=Shimia biformata TaxID=1294299 RepID=UPI00194FF846|nr:hypothetical protein [Shimia biformata]
MQANPSAPWWNSRVESWTVSSQEDLDHFLRNWGASAPPRLERRGQQKQLEAFVLNRLLRQLEIKYVFGFPLTVTPCENPDFKVRGPNYAAGIEIVEACDPREQAEMTQLARADARSREGYVHLKDVDFPGKAEKFAKLVKGAIDRKALRASTAVDHLLIYSNTDADAFEDKTWKQNALLGVNSSKLQFQRVWIISGDHLLTIKE